MSTCKYCHYCGDEVSHLANDAQFYVCSKCAPNNPPYITVEKTQHQHLARLMTELTKEEIIALTERIESAQRKWRDDNHMSHTEKMVDRIEALETECEMLTMKSEYQRGLIEGYAIRFKELEANQKFIYERFYFLSKVLEEQYPNLMEYTLEELMERLK